MEIIALIIIIFVVIKLQGYVFKKKVFDNLEYTCKFSQNESFEGDELLLVETIENRKLLPVPWLKVSIHSSKWLDFAGSASVATQEGRYTTSSFFVKGYKKIRRSWKLKCLKRGVFTIENVTFLSGDILGLNSTSIAVPVNSTLKVYPSIINLEDMFVPANYLQGDNIVRRWIIDDPFVVSGAREYSPRDSMNRIHWGATAREGKLMVKKNDFTSLQSLSVILNIQSMENEYAGTVDKDIVEVGIKVAATIFDRALRTGMPTRLCSNGAVVAEGRETIFTSEAAGIEHVSLLMETLAELKLKANKDFDLFIEDIESEIENSDIVIITSYINDVIIASSREMRNYSNRVTIILLDEAGIEEFPSDMDIYYIPKQAN